MNELRSAFPGQSEDEPVFIFLRRHWIAFASFFIGIMIMIAISLGLFIATVAVIKNSAGYSASFYNWMILLAGTFASFTILFASVAWFDFYFDIHIVTDRRIVDVNQNRLFSRMISELTLEDVEDVSVEFIGALSTFFNYGDINIQTAGTRNNFIFHNIANPREVGSIIVDLAEQSKNGVDQVDRYPNSKIKGVINNLLLKNRQELIKEGALKPDEKSDHE